MAKLKPDASGKSCLPACHRVAFCTAWYCYFYAALRENKVCSRNKTWASVNPSQPPSKFPLASSFCFSFSCFISCFEPLCCLLLLRFLAEPLKNLSKLSVRRNNNNNNYSATKWKETTKCGTSGWAGQSCRWNGGNGSKDTRRIRTFR